MRSGYARFLVRFVVALGLLGLVVPWKFGCAPHSKRSDEIAVDTARHAIINGQADLTQPAIGALVIQRRSSFCTGTLIAQQLVVTAAHCVDAVNRYGLGNVTFRTDFADPQNKFRSEYHEIQQVAKHPQYTQNSGANYDIAVLVLKNKVQNVTPIPVNRSPMDQKWIGTTVRVVGYGLIQTQPSNRSADQKYAADIPLYQIQPRAFVHYDNNTPKDQRKSACHGDSGGPALYTVSGKIRVLGVTSIAYQATGTGGGQTLCDGGAVSTRTDANYDFLRTFLLKFGDGPEPCKTDQECGSCDSCGAKLVCEPKPFPTESTHCRPCRTDADCGTGICHRFEDGFRCLQSCTSESCCPAGSLCNTLEGTGQTAAVCSPEKACPPVTCTSDSVCGPGEVCTQGACRPNPPPRSPEVCQPCQTSATCGSGICYGPTNNGRCTQPCGVGDFCPDGFVCRALYPGLANQCVPKDGTCRLPCVTDDHCNAGFACKDKFCSRKGGGIHGDSCDPMPCKAGLECVVTASGKNCMQPCGIKPGYGGTDCPADNKCQGDTRCYENQSLKVCLAACKTNADCATKGGGTCSQIGNCLCTQQSDCAAGYICNLFTYSGRTAVGACVPQDADRKCSSDFECRRFPDQEYCVPKGAGARSIGEDCDSLNRCKDGLVCLSTGSNQICLEDCSQTQQCSLGGSCVRAGRSTYICLCQGNNCPQGRTCRIAIQGYGVCQPPVQSGNRGCIDARDCPPLYECKERKCVPEVPKSEPASEPAAEPTPESPLEAPGDASGDAGVQVEPVPESKPEPTPKPEVQPETKPKPNNLTPDNALPPPPTRGCGCQQMAASSSPTGSPLAMLLLLGIFLFAGRRRRALL